MIDNKLEKRKNDFQKSNLLKLKLIYNIQMN